MGVVIKIKEHDFSLKKLRKIAFVSTKTVESISAVFNQGQQEFYETSSLNSLKPYLTVTAHYSDGTSGVVDAYTLSGTLTEGTSTITATYENKTATFNVTVSHLAVLESINAVYTQGQTEVYTNTPLNDLKSNLVVTAHYDDGTDTILVGADYTLSGTLTVGTSTITVSYGGQTDTFEVTVIQGDPVVTSIGATYTQSGTVYTTTVLDNLKTDLVVTAYYDNSTSVVLTDSDYTLSGTLVEGTSTITVTYNTTFTTTFNVTVSSAPMPANYVELEYLKTDETSAYNDYGAVITDINFVPSTDKIETKFNPVTFAKYTSSNMGAVYGDYWVSTSQGSYMYITNTGGCGIRNGYQTSGSTYTNATIQVGPFVENTDYVLSVDKDQVYVNGEQKTGEVVRACGDASPKTMVLFAAQSNGGTSLNTSTYFKGKIYYFNIYRNGSLIHALVPCYRTTDNKSGMYDTKTNTFYEGTGHLINGPEKAVKTMTSIDAVYTQGQTVVYDNTPLDNLKSDLVVTATYDDSSTRILEDSEYLLSGTLTAGTSTITATCGQLTDTFTVNVIAAPTLTDITATYIQSGTVYENSTLDSLKTDLTVVATYSDSTTRTLSDNEYVLTGTLAVGTSTITVTYESETDTFDVTVSEAVGPVLPTGYQKVQYLESPNATGEDYIDTDVNVTPQTDSIEIEFEPTSFSFYNPNFGTVCGDHWTNATAGIYSFISNTGAFYVRCANTSYKICHPDDDNAMQIDTKYKLKVYQDSIWFNDVLKTTPTGAYNPASGRKMWIFASSQNTGSSQFVGKIYGMSIASNGITTHNYVPCYRTSDNKPGMYDTVANVFRPTNGSRIVAGPNAQ